MSGLRYTDTQIFTLPWQWRTQEFYLGVGGSTNSVKTEDKENGDLGAVAP